MQITKMIASSPGFAQTPHARTLTARALDWLVGYPANTLLQGVPPREKKEKKGVGSLFCRARARPLRKKTPDPFCRRGISLLEVLISIFVLSIGLLGLASLIPIGSYQIAQMNKLDRGSTLVRQAYREVETRGFLRPEMWIDSQGDAWKDFSQYDPDNPDAWFFKIDPFVIDPLVFDPNIPIDATADIERFPYSDADNAAGSANAPPWPVRLARLNLRLTRDKSSFLGSNANEQAAAFNQANALIAARIFRGGDDVTFQRPDDDAIRPFMFRDDGGEPYPQIPYDGHYSWLMTIAPADSEETQVLTGSGAFVGNRRLFRVSVAVFYRRNLTMPTLVADPSSPPTERMVAAFFEQNGVALGGGAVHLEAENSVYLANLRPNGWMLLCGRRISSPSANPLEFRWYRIVSVDDGSGLEPDDTSELPHRDVNLAGPDWDPASYGATYAILVDDVVGVYEKTIWVDRSR